LLAFKNSAISKMSTLATGMACAGALPNASKLAVASAAHSRRGVNALRELLCSWFIFALPEYAALIKLPVKSHPIRRHA
jgi:hypothetical protein